MQRWEYKVTSVAIATKHPDQIAPALQEALNADGAKGFELVGTTIWWDYLICMMKRPTND